MKDLLVSFKVNEKANLSLGKEKLDTVNVIDVMNSRVKNTLESSRANTSDLVFSPTNSYARSILKKKPTLNKLDYIKQIEFSHPLIETAHCSFAEHYPLVLTPDSIWLTIAQGFANHVNLNAEALRDRFVKHEGKKEIIVHRNSFIKGDPNNDWEGCFSEFSDHIAEHIGKKRDLVVSNFSTTSVIEKTASEVVLMDAMQSYFEYTMMTMCGIPQVSLTGTVDDWKSIRTRAENLSEFDLEWWTGNLILVLDEFVLAAQGKPNIKFWDSFYKEDSMSGGPYITGWINTLFPYLVNHKNKMVKNPHFDKKGYGPTMDSFPNGLSKVPFKWEYYDQEFNMEFLGGFAGVHQDPDSLALTPSIGWGVQEKKDSSK